MIEAQSISFSYGGKVLLEEANFRIAKNQKVGLVGPNGAGKSTLLKLILDIEHTKSGKLTHQGTLGYVPQEIKRDTDLQNATTVQSYINPQSIHLDHEIKRLLHGLGIDLALDHNPNTTSGGQKTKLALARQLLLEPEILLLDEPTNFMDERGKRWVMNFLSHYEKTVIVISHDLELMNMAIQKVLAVNPVTHKIEEYTGNYDDYIRLKGEADALLKRQIKAKEKHIKQMEAGLHKMTRFSSEKGVRARVRQQRRIEKEKLELPQMPGELRKIKVSLPTPQKVGELPIRAEHLSKSYDDNPIIEDCSFILQRGERVAFIGANGTGKSTFIKMLVGILEPDSGTIIRNETLSLGYYSQEFEQFDMNARVLDLFQDATNHTERYARAFLGRYNFLQDKVHQRVESLSGGEKTRLSIAVLTASTHNVLVLDEPTTYLDVLSQRIILEALKQYSGSLILVSHTPDFVDELSPQRALLFPEQKAVFWDEGLLSRVTEI